MTLLIISSKEKTDVMKVVKYFKESGLLIKSVQLKMKEINKKADLQSCYYVHQLLGYYEMSSLLRNFGIQKHYRNEPKFNGVYSRHDLYKIKDGLYVINLDEQKLIGTYWIALYVNGQKDNTL